MGVRVTATMRPFAGIARRRDENIKRDEEQARAAIKMKMKLGIPLTPEDKQKMFGAYGGALESGGQTIYQRGQQLAEEETKRANKLDLEKQRELRKIPQATERSFEEQLLERYVKENPGMSAEETFKKINELKIGDADIIKQLKDQTQLLLNNYKLGELNKGKQVSEKTVKEVSEAQASKDSLLQYKEYYKPEYVGFVKGRIGSAQEKFGEIPFSGEISEQQANFYAQEAAFKNKIIKEITGAQMGEKEAERIMKQVPSRTDPPRVWESKWKQTMKNLAYIEKRRVAMLKKQGYRTSGMDATEEKPDPLGIR